MVCAPIRSIIPSLKLWDYLSVQAHKPCSISHLVTFGPMVSEKKSFESMDGRRRTTDPAYHISPPAASAQAS